MIFGYIRHLNKIVYLLFFILLGCQLQEPASNHGILFLQNRSEKLEVKKTNKNDVIELLGYPHTKTLKKDDIWIYIERTLSKGKYHRLGSHTLKTNNTLKTNTTLIPL